MPLETLPQDKKRLQVLISEDADSRLRVAAAIRDLAPGDILSELLSEHLPPVPRDKSQKRAS